MYKLYVRPHLDYGNIIYHKFDPDFTLEFTRKLGSTQYTAALAVSGAWRGTNRNKLYEELGWEYLCHRRWYRRLIHFFKLRQSESPQYLYNLVPPVHEVKYELRRPRVFEQRTERTNRFSNTYFQNCPYEWNQLDSSIQSCQNISEFKRKLIQLVRPPNNSIFNIHDIMGTKLLTRLRVEFSDLRSHKFRHNFNCSSPSCLCLTGIEDNEHFLLHCPRFATQRGNLLDLVSGLSNIDIMSLSSKELSNLLLYGHPNFTLVTNRAIVESTIKFVKSTRRFETN